MLRSKVRLDFRFKLIVASLAVNEAVSDPIVCVFDCFLIAEKEIKTLGKTGTLIS